MTKPSVAFWWYYNDMDKLRIKQALYWAQKATCPKKSVGCLLVDKDFNTIGVGYNHNPGVSCIKENCPGANKAAGTNSCRAVHAEIHALMNCKDIERIHTCYTTLSPCFPCMKSLLATPCTRIVVAEFYDCGSKEVWLDEGREWLQVQI
jgi:deoxycytidylate deaminase